MKQYKVQYKDVKGSMTIEAISHEEAQRKFLEDAHPMDKPVIVEELNEVEELSENTAQVFSENPISSPRSTDQTQKEILNQLKQINWAIRAGVLLIMLVVTGVIPIG